MVTLVVVCLLLAIAVPAYEGLATRARVRAAIGDIGSLHVMLEQYRLKNNDQLPASLAEIVSAPTVDPWGRPYQYLNIMTADPGNGGFRKDGNLNPLNTDYDLYSVGKDGSTAGPLSAKASRDDIVRANDGAYIGLGEDY